MAHELRQKPTIEQLLENNFLDRKKNQASDSSTRTKDGRQNKMRTKRSRPLPPLQNTNI